MKNLLGFFSVFAVIALLAIVLKPSDDSCITKVKEQMGIQVQHHSIIGDVINSFTDAGANIVLEVDDCLFYKAVVNRYTGHTVAVVWFGYPILLDNNN